MGERIVRGYFEGTGNDIYLCLGGVPRRIEFWALEAATPDHLLWDKYMVHGILTNEGVAFLGTDGTMVDLANGQGVAPYYGGDLMTTSNQTTTTYGDGIYIERDEKDYRFYTVSAAGHEGDAESEDIVDWTLDTNGSQTGSFNGDVVGTYIGEGSLIRVMTNDGVEYTSSIITLAAGAGSVDDAVKLAHDVPTGTVNQGGGVRFIGGRYGFKPVAIGKTTTAGVRLSDGTYTNVSNEVTSFIAWME